MNKLPKAQAEKNKIKVKAQLNKLSKTANAKVNKTEVMAQLNKITQAYQVPEGYSKIEWPMNFQQLQGSKLEMYKMITNDISQQSNLVKITYWYFFNNEQTTLSASQFWEQVFEDFNYWRVDVDRIKGLVHEYMSFKEYQDKNYKIPFELYVNKDSSSYIVAMPLAKDKYTGRMVGAFIAPQAIESKYQNALLKLFDLVDSLPDSVSMDYYQSLVNATEDYQDPSFMNSGTQL